MCNRYVTKQDVFNFELKHKPWLIQYNSSGIESDIEFSIEVLDSIFERNIFGLSCYEISKIFEFLDDYKDIMDWSIFLKHDTRIISYYGLEILSRYGKYLPVRKR